MWEKIKEKLFQAFIGVESQRDEYQLEEIRHLLSKTGAGLWLSNMVLLLILFVQDERNQTVSVATIGLLLITTVSSGYLIFNLYRHGLNITEFESEGEFKSYRRRALAKAYFQGFYLGLLIYLVVSVVLPVVMGDPITLSLAELIRMLLIGTLGVGSLSAVFVYFRLKKYQEET